MIICDSREIPYFGFSPEQTTYKKILYLGTHITQKSLDWGFYYFGVGNRFWSIIQGLYQSKELSQAVEDYNRDVQAARMRFCKQADCKVKIREAMASQRASLIATLQDHGIVINDLIGYCKCTGAEDDKIIEDSVLPNDGNGGFHDVPSLMRDADVIVINGLGLKKNGRTRPNSARFFLELFGFAESQDIRDKVVYVCGSSAYRTTDEAVNFWDNAIHGVLR